MCENYTDKNDKCPVCGKDKSEYDPSWKCAKNHDWRGYWRKNKTTKKYKQYIKRRHESMKKTVRKKLEELNKKTPPEYIIRKSKNSKQ